MAPFFSVVLTNYNRIDSVIKVVDAILNQQFTNFELIVIDDCSTDGSANMLRQIEDSRITFLSTPQNSGGPALPRNIGIAKARGKWICFCDSDDYFRNDHLKRLFEFIESKKITNAIITTNAYITKDGNATTEKYFSKMKPGEISFLSNWKSNKAILSTLCISNSNIIEFCIDKEYHSIEDYFFVLDNLLQGKKHFFIETPSVCYSVNSTDSVRGKNRAGEFIYKYKYQFFRTRNLAHSTNRIALIRILVWDYLKGIIKSVVR